MCWKCILAYFWKDMEMSILGLQFKKILLGSLCNRLSLCKNKTKQSQILNNEPHNNLENNKNKQTNKQKPCQSFVATFHFNWLLKMHALEMVHFLEQMTLQFIYVYSETCENTSDGLYIWSYDSDNLLASQRAWGFMKKWD